ncbi:MAG: glycosyltransferase [Bacteroidales bacterium]|nr:glycosyltransferase [Bacteroidales bacterium]
MTVATIIILIITVIYVYLVAKCCIVFHNYDDNTASVTSELTPSVRTTDIIVSAKNESQNITKFLDSIKAQTLDGAHLILIDDNSTDNTYDLAAARQDVDITLLKNTGKGKKQALNFGISHSKADYILSTDADCFPQPRWAETLIAAAQNVDADMIMAPVIIEAPDKSKMFQRLWQAESFALITITAGTCISGSPVMCNGGNIGYRSTFIKKSIGDINGKYASGDDMFMMESAGRQHKRFVYAKNPDAVIRTDGVENLHQLLNQRARWVSKTGGYTDSYILFFAFAILLGNMAAIAAPIFAAFNLMGWGTAALSLLLKFAVDFASVRVSSEYYNERQRIMDIVVLGIVYPYYVVASVVSYFVRGFKWK